ncbi:MAG: hypothetical protein AAGA56_15535, partial [Myxococcota bacterium]
MKSLAPNALLRRTIAALGFAASFIAGFVGCGAGEAEPSLCEPGSNVFCRCRGGAAGTKQCGADGNSFGVCESYDGTCDELPRSSGTGPSDAPSLPNDSLPPPPPGTYLGACTDASECAEGQGCIMGFCTHGCDSYVDCASEDADHYAECAIVPGADSGDYLGICSLTCSDQDFCEEVYG